MFNGAIIIWHLQCSVQTMAFDRRVSMQTNGGDGCTDAHSTPVLYLSFNNSFT